MPTFKTPGPISATVSILMGDVHVSTADDRETLVEVRPSNQTRKADLKIVEGTTIDYSDGQLVVKTPKHLGSLFGRTGSVEVVLRVPSGSQLRLDTGMGELRGDGRFGECRFRTGYGDLHLEHGGPAHIVSGMGQVTVGRVDGDAHVSTGSGSLRVNEITGSATVKNSNGDTAIGRIAGALRVNNSNGDISIEAVGRDLTAKTAHGNVRVGEVRRGSVVLQTAMGDLSVGISPGTAAWLDVNTSTGRVLNQMRSSHGPQGTGDTVEIRGRTYQGDITIHHSFNES